MTARRDWGRAVTIASVAILVETQVVAAPPPATAAPQVTIVKTVPPGTYTVPLHLTRIGSKLTTGQTIGKIRAGVFCLPAGNMTYSSNQNPGTQEKLTKTFYAEAANEGFKTPPTTTNLFADDTSNADYAIGVLIESMDINLCLPMAGFGDVNSHGSVSYGLEWQVYSNLERKIVADIHTVGSYEAQTGKPDTFMEEALTANARKVLADPQFRSVYAGSGRPPTALLQPNGFEQIKIANVGDGPSAIPDTLGSVVAVVAGDGFGSGFLIDSTGLLITNRHVVGDTKFVKIRWSDGFEGLGEVLRSDEHRDVALIKTDPRGRKPLRLAKETPSPGDEVFAIGTPLDQKFQSTVTKGVVSGVRVLSGLNFIQSDVVVNHGNSGGPLLDAKGQVLGVTVAGYQIGGATTGINLFIPIRDAFDFLALKP